MINHDQHGKNGKNSKNGKYGKNDDDDDATVNDDNIDYGPKSNKTPIRRAQKFYMMK